uniref:Uncharacterized protein LOC107404641 n=1 Tax=Rhizophora mucronata TaxID=61149 RepID=A0A2P2LX54_RHIMU
MVKMYGSVSTWIHQFLACMGGCFGCCSKLAPIIAVDEPSKGLGIQGQVVKKPSMSDDFWSTTTSACDLDHSAIQSQRSVSSISVSNQNIGGGGTVGVSSNADFANHGLLLWNQSRLQWTGNKMPGNRAHQRWDHRLSWNAPYENLLGMTNGFARPIPLSVSVEMQSGVILGFLCGPVRERKFKVD